MAKEQSYQVVTLAAAPLHLFISIIGEMRKRAATKNEASHETVKP